MQPTAQNVTLLLQDTFAGADIMVRQKGNGMCVAHRMRTCYVCHFWILQMTLLQTGREHAMQLLDIEFCSVLTLGYEPGDKAIVSCC